jgi:CubicO group peptidase (beta-lactamase class C family)
LRAAGEGGRRGGALLATALALALAGVPVSLWAQDGAPSPSPSGEATRIGPTDPVELEAFLDGLMIAQMRDNDVAGATVAVVRDGQVLLTKGYGWADVEGRVRVDPERTLFRIGSVSKLFTWIAVMQLVEDGLLDLDRDVNEYLDFTIPATFPEPITPRHLLTHTPGFEEDSRGLFTDDIDGLVPMGRWLAENMPARIRPPGLFSAYSNYGTALAGLIVERASGMSWDEFTESRILEPLGMGWASTRQPLPDHLEPHMSKGYSWEGAGWKEEDWEIITGAAPAGSMSVSAGDMARFMISQLEGGALDGARILSEEGTRTMQARHFEHDARLPGFGLGFYEKSSHGVRIVGHGGNTRWFHTDLSLFPELGLGTFVSYNTSTGGELSWDGFLPTFLNHYFPTEPPEALPADGFEDRVAGLTGTYRANRSSYTTFQKAFDLAGGVTFEAGDGVLIQSGGLGGSAVRGVEVGENLFQEEFGETRIAFRTDESGKATHAFLSVAPMFALERVAWHGNPRLHQSLLGIGMLVFLVLVLAALGRLVRRVRGRPREGDRLEGRIGLARRALVASGAAHLVFAVWVIVLVSDFWALLTGPMTGLYMALAFPVLGLIASLVAGWATVTAWRGGEGDRWLRLRLSAGVTLALLVSLSLHYWNLLGWRV